MVAATPPEPPSRGQHLATLARYIGKLDESGQGVLASDVIDSLYPLRIGDGLEEVREAIAQLTRTEYGRAPAPIRLGAVLGRHKDTALPGNICLSRVQLDGGMIRWTCMVAPPMSIPPPPPPEPPAEEPRIPAEPAPVDALKSPMVDPTTGRKFRKAIVEDDPDSRTRIELCVGQWLVQHLKDLPYHPTTLVVLSGAFGAIHPGDVTAKSNDASPRVCVVYTKATIIHGGRLAMPTRLWDALRRLSQEVDVYVSFCSDEPPIVTFDRYDKLAWTTAGTAPKEADGTIAWPIEIGLVVGDFRQIVPHLQLLRTTTTEHSLMASPSLTKFEQMILREDKELAAAVTRGWLLTGTKPDDGICAMWSRRCEVENAPFLYVSVYSTARGIVPGHLRALVRMDLGYSGLVLSDLQLEQMNVSLEATLTAAEYKAMCCTSRLVSLECAGDASERVGTMLYEASQRIRPKKLSLVHGGVR